eukprot:TRINITY_DN220_c0_g2_i1.p1 TRINITY_DN220_c0_g2~~TRINITY_DN220_c0_g2_i1.p1  ORF type:complete len:240 (+),score=61.34 TRINITY_DN220_c0_g2_i1:26-745(+)
METKEINWRNKLLIALQGQNKFDFELWYPSGVLLEDIKAMIELSDAKKGEEIFENFKDFDEFTVYELKESDLVELGFDLNSRKRFMHYQNIFKESIAFQKISQQKCKKLYQRITNSFDIEEYQNKEENENQKENDKKEIENEDENQKEVKSPSKKMKNPNEKEIPNEIIMEMIFRMQSQLENFDKKLSSIDSKLSKNFIYRGALSLDNSSPISKQLKEMPPSHFNSESSFNQLIFKNLK